MARRKLGDLLREAGLVDEMQLAAALGHQRQWGGRLGQVLVQMGLVTEQAIAEAVSRQLALPVVRLAGSEIAGEVIRLVPRELCEKHQLIPWSRTRNERGQETVHVAMSDPTNLAVIDELAFRTGKRIEVGVAADRDVELAIRHHFYGERWAAPAPPEAPLFQGPELELQPGDDAPLEIADEARRRVERSVTIDLDLEEPVAPRQTPAVPNGIYGGIERTPAQPLPVRQAVPAPERTLLLGQEGPPSLTLRERMLRETLEAELGTEGLPDRQLLLALARLLIRKGVIGEDEWIRELSRR